ncbi:hypothetical protein AAY86_12195 [Pseudomonas amygdali pv. tabaci str. ATCC 11528]|uniref:Secreted protein n=25 Tax=Pseudomonas syringae group TaxID=136849 RepID=A0A0Q0ALM5_PSEAJ|nr:MULTISPECIES: hypothetical protein [Pseudomonas]EGH21198.1 hypothetical protein PSYMO_06675 [Pseudomonas amygdali pv. mori str. 301020]KPW63528.1 Uncharacterized protein ALO82_00200 [Pseudomonas syringae pv. broussonetiae]KPX04495.1 Uncharacterized protein ALO74_03934 [Pseudomonas syringae pv. cunninghamiae]AAZ33432.1 conserved hypothetical protein [Pseudomonas savastanoi pv. phaseolicola 1448A]ARA82711.1 hypothetical protein B5U27_23005 [Pseudomonas amygdali pv. lachrymans]
MKLEMARGLFIFGALAIATVAVAALEQPSTQILTTQHGEGYCPLPRVAKSLVSVQPDHDLLLFMYSLAQGAGVRN